MARKPHEIVDEEMPDDDGLIDSGPVDEGDESPDPAADEGDESPEPRTLEAELPDEPTEEEELEGAPPAKTGDEEEELPDLTDEEAAADVKPADDAEADEEGEPFAELEGARTFKGAGVFVPEGEPLERLRQSLGVATRTQEAWTRERSELSEQVRELRETRSAEAEVAADVMDLVFKDFAAMDEEQLYEWAVNFKAKEATLRNDIREKWLARREQELERRATRRDPAVVERERQEAVQAIQTTITATVADLFKRPDLAALTADDRARIQARALERAEQLTLTAKDDSMAEYGVKKGESYLNAQQIYEWALDRAEVRASTARAKGVAIANRRKLGTGKTGKAPGGGDAARSTAAGGEPEWKPAKTREEWLERMQEP